MSVALPTLAKPAVEGGLHATGSPLLWIVDSYTIVFAGLLLTAGSLGDRFGRYRGLAAGLAVFGTGSLLSALAPNATTLILTRALMGVGAAFIMPATLSILTNVFRDDRERAKAIGVWAGVSAVGIGIGPVAGGFLLTHFWWGAVFLVNVPVVMVALFLGFRYVPESRDSTAPSLDPLGAGLSIVGLGALLWAIIEGPAKGWASGEVLGGFVLAAVVLAGFLAWELRCKEPMLDIRYFKNRRFSAASGAITITFLTLFGTIFLLTQYFQSVLGYSTIKAGAVLIPQSLMMMVFAPMSTRWVHRFGNKLVVTFGMLVVTADLLAMMTFTTSNSTIHVVGVTMWLGFGVAHIMAPATESIMGALPRDKAGVGSAMNDTTRQVGGAVGVALLGSVLSSKYGSHVTSALTGVAPSSVIDQAKDSVGAALGAAKGNADAQPFANQIITAAHDGFVNGFHLAVGIAAGIVLIGAIAVYSYLPARRQGVSDGDHLERPLRDDLDPAGITAAVSTEGAELELDAEAEAELEAAGDRQS